MKPFAESCVQNRDPILAVPRQAFAERGHVLEIARGTGRHAIYFGAPLPHLTWQTRELPENHAGIRLWLAETALPSVRASLARRFPPVITWSARWLAHPGSARAVDDYLRRETDGIRAMAADIESGALDAADNPLVNAPHTLADVMMNLCGRYPFHECLLMRET